MSPIELLVGQQAVFRLPGTATGAVVQVEWGKRELLMRSWLADGTSGPTWRYTDDRLIPMGVTCPQYDGPALLAEDLDGDLEPELVVGFKDFLGAFEVDGTVLWTTNARIAASNALTAFDFDADGRPEVVVADADGLRILDGRTGEERWAHAQTHERTHQWSYRSPTLADLDGDRRADLVVMNTSCASLVGDVEVYAFSGDTWPELKVPPMNEHGYSITSVNDDGTVPEKAVANWTVGYNSWRSQHTPDGRYHPRADAVPTVETCASLCPTGTLAVRVANGGPDPLPADVPVEVRAPDGAVLARFVLDSPVPAGRTSEAHVVEVPGDVAVEVVVDPGDVVVECDESDNAVVIDRVCRP